MEAAGEAKSLIDKIIPPRLEDAGLEDCALPPESIKEAFLKAASAVRSIVSDSGDESGDEGGCVDDPWEEHSDVLVGITDGVTAPSEGCAGKGGGLTEVEGDKVVEGGASDAEAKADEVVGPDLPEGGEACVDGLQGLEIRGKGKGKGKGILGKKLEEGKDDVDDEEKGEDKPILAQGYVLKL